MYKYIVLDMDGTLLNSKHQINPELRNLLIELQNEGVKLILCSGRNINSMRKYAEELRCYEHETYIVSDNGGSITRISNGQEELLKTSIMTKEQVSHIVDIVGNRTKDAASFMGKYRYSKKLTSVTLLVWYRYGHRPRFGINREANKILFTDKPEKINQVYDQVKAEINAYDPEINVFRSVPHLIEVTPPGSLKGSALQQICEDNHFDVKQMIAFGDGENDISMLEYVPSSVAMGNGFDTVKAVASDICDTNDNNGIYKYLSAVFKR